ncbi:Do family serine endopeptidase [Pelagibacterium xiamenense]|uniref:Do family serine endopeptidase n=1 Tax=Pelagibacterium xiamenense TaxID=2901140 RepID=UPI001E4A5456|nr:Do family serine endopeptidase [Pelagibacterium xiamenense]MCD7059516.1 Do family serine endopeptidase [Pelagibacterium xiamenense]
MRSLLLTPSRKLIAASTLALVIAGGTAATYLLPSQPATAQIEVQTGAPNLGFADLVEAVSPAVVAIQVRAEVPTQDIMRRGPGFEFDFPDLPEDHPLRRFFDQFDDQFTPPGAPNGQAPRRFMQAVGSGFIISQDGYIVTNNHVVADASEVLVVLQDDTELAAEVVGTDPRTDLALLKVQDDSVNDLPYVEFADDEGRVGDWVVAVGNPFGLGGTVTAGIISARGRDINASAYDDFIQIDAPINRGNSGGPSFNLSGEVVGVNTAIFSPSGGNVGIAFAIPAHVAQNVISQLRDDGTVTRGFLGVSLQDISEDLAAGLGLDSTDGALVTETIADAPAGAAGVESGDVIVSVDGQDIEDGRELSRVISQIAPGTSVELGIVRDGQDTAINVTLDRLPDDLDAAPAPSDRSQQEEAEPTSTSIGVMLEPHAGGEGLVVAGVEPDSPAATRGLAPGDVVLEADGQVLTSMSQFEDVLAAVRDSGRQAVPLKVERDGVVRFLGVPFASE